MTESTTGILQLLPQASGGRGNNRGRGGFLRDPELSFQPTGDDVWVSQQLIRKYTVPEGAELAGPVKTGKKGLQLAGIERICGLTPDEFAQRQPFERLTAINPQPRFRTGDSGHTSMRIVELIAPIARGTRGLIVAPPKAGKTRLLEEIAQAVKAEDPETRVIVLLIDERPEEVTHFRRGVDAEVLASSSDQPIESHVKLAELTMAHIRCELECGRNVVVLIDSITRLARAFNLQGRGRARTLSGGMDAQALEIPRRFFGLARNIENGGSVTVVATALVDTGSRMDDLIFEEFKSTGNSELMLDRSLAEERIFPAINVLSSSTRNEELLYSDEEMRRLVTLRRWLAGGSPKAALRGLLKLIDATESNAELLMRLKPSN